jgi:rhamnosyltransferase
MLVSIVIRTLNEARFLPAVFDALDRQRMGGLEKEVVLVDSGSTDGTVEIAEARGARIRKIAKSDFTFGRSLNYGCEAARGEILVFISGHCIPCHEDWLQELVRPILDEVAAYSYGKQVGNSDSKFSECQLLKKYFPDASKVPQQDFFVNNANSALAKAVWDQHRFDESLTGLEDMDLGKRLTAAGHKMAYVASAGVYHLHDESWRQVKRRYEREAIALQKILPEVHLSFGDFLRFFVSSVLLDAGVALQERKLHKVACEIVLFRFMQFWGAYRGNHIHRQLSREAKFRYFYPK